MSGTGLERQSGGIEQEQFASRSIVVKIGSSTITRGATKESPLNVDLIDDIARQCSQLYKNGVDVVIVSSGAVACGRHLLSIDEDDIRDKQVEAVYGQPTLISTWVNAFRKHGVVAGQALITENDLEEAKKVLPKSLKSGVVIVNRNDAVSTDEMEAFLRLADNDYNTQEVAEIIDADTVLLLTDVDGVLDSNNQLIENSSSIDGETRFFQSSDIGTGGMVTKVRVCKDLSEKGKRCVIANGSRMDVVLDVARGKTLGYTTFQPKTGN